MPLLVYHKRSVKILLIAIERERNKERKKERQKDRQRKREREKERNEKSIKTFA